MLASGGALAAVFLLLTWSLFWCLGIGYQDIRSLVQARLIGEGTALTPQLQVIGYLLAYWAIIRARASLGSVGKAVFSLTAAGWAG